MKLFASLLMRNDLLNILKARINCGIMKIPFANGSASGWMNTKANPVPEHLHKLWQG